MGRTEVVLAPDLTPTPTAADARKAIEYQVYSRFRDGLIVTDVNKTDAQSGQLAGIPFYTLECRVNTEAVQTLYFSIDGWKPYTAPAYPYVPFPTDLGGRYTVPSPSIWTGEKYTIDGEARFTMKESGWVIQGARLGRITASDASAPSSAQAENAIAKGVYDAVEKRLKIISVETTTGTRMRRSTEYHLN